MATRNALDHAGLSPVDWAMGEHLCARGGSGGSKVRAYAMLVLFGAVVAASLWAAIDEYRRSGWAAAEDFFVMSGVLAGVLAFIGGICFYAWNRRLDFYEHGAVLRRPILRNVCVRYDDLDQFRFDVVRVYQEGVYSGSRLRVVLKTFSGDKINLSVRIKEKPSLFSVTQLYGKFGPDAEVEDVRRRICEIMCAKWIDRLNHDGAIEWCRMCTITKHGIVPSRGKLRNVLVRFDEIGSVKPLNDSLHLHRIDERRAFCVIPMDSPNYTVGVAVLDRFAGEQRGVGELDGDTSIAVHAA